MSNRLPILVFVLCLPALCADVIAIRAGRLVDPERGSAVPNQIILVENGKFSAIGANLTIPQGAQIIDLSNYTVLPGLVDACECELLKIGLDPLSVI